MAKVLNLLVCLLIKYAVANLETYYNDTSPALRQLLDFKMKHPKPIGLLTVGSGSPVEIRDMISINSDLFRDEFFFDSQAHLDGERRPERVVHNKGIAAWGYFEVTNDVSEYTKADVFNGIGKKTPVLARFSIGTTERGSSDVTRDLKGLTSKFYTKEGNLDFLSLNTPMFLFKDPIDFVPFVHLSQRNPRTYLHDDSSSAAWDFITLKPDSLSSIIYLLSDYGLPDGYRYSDYFPAHTYELVNKHGDRWYAKFNFRSNQGFKKLTSEQAAQIQGTDLDYYTRDLYNAIENHEFPSWTLEMDIMSLKDVQDINYNPFDITVLWKNGTYKTVKIGHLMFNRISDNQFRDMEKAAFNPANLVPGIPGPVDSLFRGRRFAYRDAQNYRLGRNQYNIGVNAPLYRKSYNRDGVPPVAENGKDAPNYFPNSFNGPLPLVDESRPKEQLLILDSNTVDLQEAADTFNKVLPNEEFRKTAVQNLVLSLQRTIDSVRVRALKLLCLADRNLGRRVDAGLKLARLRDEM